MTFSDRGAGALAGGFLTILNTQCHSSGVAYRAINARERKPSLNGKVTKKCCVGKVRSNPLQPAVKVVGCRE